jgi:4-hydroxybenzoate polyprenyltransferase
MEPEQTQFSKATGIFYLFRPNRTIMVSVITGTGAFAAGVTWDLSILLAVGAWLLAVGGFSLDFYADREVDKTGPRSRLRKNPIANGSISLRSGLIFSMCFIVSSSVLFVMFSPWSLILWGIIVLIVIGLAMHWFETPFTRAVTLGMLQALYVLMGAAKGSISTGIWLIVVIFFFAMFGGRGVIDIRDFPQDDPSPVQTLPKRYGIKRTAQFSAICLIIAYIVSFIVYLTGEFNAIYLYLDLAFMISGFIFTFIFLRDPTPKLAESFTMVYMMGQGPLICLAIILGSLIL